MLSKQILVSCMKITYDWHFARIKGIEELNWNLKKELEFGIGIEVYFQKGIGIGIGIKEKGIGI